MSKKRYINTKFWSDGFVVGLEPLERYLFLYFLTNEHTDICGVYELPLKIIERETGIAYNSLLELIDKLKGKVYLIDDWVYIKNFAKHQACNPKVDEGIKRSLELVPEEIKKKIDDIDIGYNRLSIVTEQLKLKLKPKPILNNKKTTNVVSKQSLLVPLEEDKEINLVLAEFYKVNPTINFGNCTQRNAVRDLVKKFGTEKLIPMIQWHQGKMNDRYCPTATTPLAFKDKLGDIKVYADKLKDNPLITNLGEI